MTQTTIRVNSGNFLQKTLAATVEHDAHAPVATARATSVSITRDLVVPDFVFNKNRVLWSHTTEVPVTEDLSVGVRHLFERLRNLGANAIWTEAGGNGGISVAKAGEPFLTHLGYTNPEGLQHAASAGARSAVEAATLVEHQSAGVMSRLARVFH